MPFANPMARNTGLLQEALRLASAIYAHICDSGKANARPAAMLRQLHRSARLKSYWANRPQMS